MDWQAKLVAATGAIVATVVLAFVPGCLSDASRGPATSIVEPARASDEGAARVVQHQPTILRAEAAAPPVSDPSENWPIIPLQAEAPLAPSPPTAGVSDAGPAQVADLLPVQTLDEPPPNQR